MSHGIRHIFISGLCADSAYGYFIYYSELLNFNEKDILFIMGLIFISLVPLHKESRIRQKAFYLMGLKTLNLVLTVKKL